jgi:hypothetical protein
MAGKESGNLAPRRERNKKDPSAEQEILLREKRALQRELSPLEEEISACERALAEYDQALCDPAVLSDSSRVRQLICDRHSAAHELERLIPRWETVMERLESLSNG